MKCEPGEPESLDASNLLAIGIGDGDAAIRRIPGEVETLAVDGIAEPGFALLVEFNERIGLVDPVDTEPDHDFLGMVGIRCLVVNSKVSVPGLVVAGVGIALIITGESGVVG